MTLRSKIALHTSMVVVLTMTAILAIVILRQTQALQEQANKRGISIARGAAATLSNSLLVNDRITIRQDAAEIIQLEDVTFVAIYDKNGRSFAFESRNGIGPDDLPDDDELRVPVARGVERRVGEESWHVLDVRAPVTYHDRDGRERAIGSIRIGLSLAELDAQIATIRVRVVALWTLALAVGYLSASFLSRRLSRPIEELAVAARRYAAGRFDYRIETRGRDEIAHLGRSLDTMSQDIQARTLHLVEARQRAEAANRAKSEFLSNVSHELRTPLHCIISFAQFGLQRTDDAEMIKFFERIQSGGDSLLGLVNNLLDLAACESDRMDVDHALVSMPTIIASVADELRSLADERKLELACRTDGSASEASVLGDATRLLQVLRNVLGNAIRFSPEGSVIETYTHLTADDVIVEVRDFGPGIPPEETEAIFEKFVQSSATKTGAGGTGLGLAICREILRAHDGSITAENRDEGGATFRIRIPRASGAKAGTTTEPANASARTPAPQPV